MDMYNSKQMPLAHLEKEQITPLTLLIRMTIQQHNSFQ